MHQFGHPFETRIKNLIFISKKSIYNIFIVKIVGKIGYSSLVYLYKNIFFRIIFHLLKSKFVKAIFIK